SSQVSGFAVVGFCVMRQPIIAAGIALCLVWARPVVAQTGEEMYKQVCASCHEAGLNRAPDRQALSAMTPERVLAAMESGPMLSIASNRNSLERRAIAEFVTGKSFGKSLDLAPSPQAMCSAKSSSLPNGPEWNGWGAGTTNARYQDQQAAGL